jgi:Tfp pilus assembly protein PilF
MTQATSDRMRQLQAMLQKEPNDTFLLYGLALEYKKANDAPHAIEYLDRVLTLDAGYCYAYHQKGLVYESLDDVEAAKRTYREGMEAAKKKGDEHARSEIEAALEAVTG